MAASGGLAAEHPREDVLQWLKNLPLAPEYHPTLAEFQDPIAYIFKIEKEASKYGICKIVPPVLQSPRKTAIANLNRSLAARVGASSPPTFTTRQQQIGFCPRKPRPVQKPVWQSGANYTFQEFEAKAKSFEKSYLKKYTKKGGTLSPLETETLYWKATVDKPFSVEYANDMPGSAFSVRKNSGREGIIVEGMTVGETEWNMRGVARAKGSLLRFMKEEIPGVTSPMLYIAMMFSWFAWHVEDHDLHSLNYMHMGAGKTWYGVPKEAAVAFEEVVRVHGYGGEINPLVTFAVLGEKTTVMSPEVFIRAGVPCCRLVQNAGEFVVTFPRAYHSGFSHGFNCGEASNIATPEWLRVAKDAAIRRASINYPPMVSHFQLLYDLTSELCSRLTVNIGAKPRSSRLKEKQKGEGEMVTKEMFVKNVIHNNDLLHNLGKGSSVVLLPQSSSDISLRLNSLVGSQFVKPFGLYAHKGFMEQSKASSGSHDAMPDRSGMIDKVKGMGKLKTKFGPPCEGTIFPTLNHSGNMHIPEGNNGRMVMRDSRFPDQRLFSCVTCGILNYDCVAIIQPREAAARYFMSADCSFFNDWTVVSGISKDSFVGADGDANTSTTRRAQENTGLEPYDSVLQYANHPRQMIDQSIVAVPEDTKPETESSALGLLALNYGDFSSDSDEDLGGSPYHVDDHNGMNNLSEGNHQHQDSASPSSKEKLPDGTTSDNTVPQQKLDCGSRDTLFLQHLENNVQHHDGHKPVNYVDGNQMLDRSIIASENGDLADTESAQCSKAIVPGEDTTGALLSPGCDEDSSRMHVFCLEHAVEVEQQLRRIGGVHIFLLCHPDYPGLEEQAKLISEELGTDYLWKETDFRAATKEDEERIQSALDIEEAIPGNGDWAVKLGINLFYSANLSWSPLYSKQMAYNSVIYNAFGRASPVSSPKKSTNNVSGRSAKQRKVVVGKWCGRVWMSNQVHPFIANWDSQYHNQEEEKLEVQETHIFQIETPRVSVKSGKRKKPTTVKRPSVTKVVPMGFEEAAASDDLGVSHKQIGRLNSRKRTGGPRRKVSAYNSAEEHDESLRRSKITTDVVNEDVDSDESLQQYKSSRRGRAGHFDCEKHSGFYETAKKAPKKQRRTPRVSQPKYVEKESEASGDSLLQEDNILQWHGRVPRSNKQMKLLEREQTGFEVPLEEEESSQKSHKVYRRRKAKCVTEKKDAVAAPSEMTESIISQKQNSYSRIPDEAVFDDDDDPLDAVQWQTTSLSEMEREDAMSDDASDYNDRRAIMLRGKDPMFDSTEDLGVSDDPLYDEDVHQRTISRVNKRAKVTEDRQQDFTRKTPRGNKRTKFIKGEVEDDVISDDLVGEGYDKQQQGRVLRSKEQRKPAATLSQMESRIPQQVRGGKKPMQKETLLLSAKQQKRPVNDDDEFDQEGGPSTRLRKRPSKPAPQGPGNNKSNKEKKGSNSSRIKVMKSSTPAGGRHKSVKMKEVEEEQYQCDIDGCTMSFGSKQELNVHKRNICPVKGCGKVFFSHKYLVQHRRVHVDDRPLKCPWKGCKMSFKWAWARTEHIRVHTGARPYVCAEEGCGQTFRFVSDFSRHKRKTGHIGRKDSE
ncbi:unnamed protein product [Linum tenue]|uniref:Lysine-specific demethylase REF6 n=2 Tax=Linum tenue TaxID=586396 RepID=A0AAV0MHN0_9ROSI|nr:unnamed protein product [Linum tenue]